MIAALYVDPAGCYDRLNSVEAWGIDRDARTYAGPYPIALERHGYEKARRIGMAAMVGGKDKTRIREATPAAFRDVLLSIARTVR